MPFALFLVQKEKLSWLDTLKYFSFLGPALVYKHLQQRKQSNPIIPKQKQKRKKNKTKQRGELREKDNKERNSRKKKGFLCNIERERESEHADR